MSSICTPGQHPLIWQKSYRSGAIMFTNKYYYQILQCGKCDLSDFDHGMIIDARLAGMYIYETADLLLIFLSKRNTLLMRTMARRLGANREATVTQITTNCREQKSISNPWPFIPGMNVYHRWSHHKWTASMIVNLHIEDAYEIQSVEQHLEVVWHIRPQSFVQCQSRFLLGPAEGPPTQPMSLSVTVS